MSELVTIVPFTMQTPMFIQLSNTLLVVKNRLTLKSHCEHVRKSVIRSLIPVWSDSERLIFLSVYACTV